MFITYLKDTFLESVQGYRDLLSLILDEHRTFEAAMQAAAKVMPGIVALLVIGLVLYAIGFAAEKLLEKLQAMG